MPEGIGYGTNYHKKESFPKKDFGYATNYHQQKTSARQADFGYKTDYHKKTAMAVRDNGYAAVYHKQKAMAVMNPGYASNYNEQPMMMGTIKNEGYSGSWTSKRTDHAPEVRTARAKKVVLTSNDTNYPTRQRGSTVATRKRMWRMSDSGVVRY